MITREPRLGVDFGTSNTVAVLAGPDGSTRPLLFDGSELLPSAVCAEPSTGALLTGRGATHGALAYPMGYEPNPKRCIDEAAVLLGGAEVAVVDLIGAVLARVVDEARRVIGGDPSSGTPTWPPAGRPHR